MPTVTMHFPGGRYHATPWGHHVNEGLIEWPPCPWRLLRALIATGYAKHGWTEVPPLGRRLIETLASVLPTYQLPQASAAHSRHYMPIGELAKGIEKTTLVFDTWANVGDDELAIRWDCELDDEAAELFQLLVESLGYLGRSESWVEASVESDEKEFREDRLAIPQVNGADLGPEWEQLPLMTAVHPDAYAQWQAAQTEAALACFPLPEGKRKPPKSLLRKRAAAVAPFPQDLLDCLQKDTAWWKKQHHWSQPPGTRRVLYWRRVDSLVVSRPQAVRPLPARPVEAILLVLATPSRNKSALPHVRRTLPQSELLHRAIVGRVGRGHRVDCPELTGQDVAGKPLRNGHRHAHILPLDLDRDQHIDHILIYAPMGLGDAAQAAIRSLKRTWTKGGVGDLQLAVVGRGDLQSLRHLPQPLRNRTQALLGCTADGGTNSTDLQPTPRRSGSRVWTSLTPFVPPRYVKRNGKNSLEGQVQAELKSRGLPAAGFIKVQSEPTRRLRDFIRVRGHGGGPPPVDVGFALRIELNEPATGPISLGYASHFGLGLFLAEGSSHE